MGLKIFSDKQVSNGCDLIKKNLLDNFELWIYNKQYTDPKEALAEFADIFSNDELTIRLTDGCDTLISVIKTEDDKEPVYTINQFDSDSAPAVQTIHDLLNLKF